MIKKTILIIILFFICASWLYSNGGYEKTPSVLIVNIGDGEIEIKCTGYYLQEVESWGNFSYKIYCYNNGKIVFEGKSTIFIYVYWRDE